MGRKGNPSVLGSNNTNELSYPSLAKSVRLATERGEGRFFQYFFEIPLCQRGIKTTITAGIGRRTEFYRINIAILLGFFR
jgi:hypothetical protein